MVRGYGQCAGSTNRSTLARAENWRRSASLAAIGALVFGFGVIVYSTDRELSNFAFFPSVAWLAGRNLFGMLGGWLPSFVHTFSFSLFTAAALPDRPVPAYGASVGWFVVNLLFEVGQHSRVSSHLALFLKSNVDLLPLTRPLANYFVHGTFDVGDIAAALVGALAAGVVLRLVHCGREKNYG